MESALRELLNGIAVDGEASWSAIQKLIQLSSFDKENKQFFRDKIFEDRERQLLDLLPNMNHDDPDSLEWIALVGQLKRHMKDGPESTHVQRIIGRMNEKRLEVFRDEDDFLEKLWEIKKSPTQSEQMGLYPIEQELLEFMDQAFRVYMSKRDNPQLEQEE